MATRDDPEYQRKYYAANRDRKIAAAREWQQANAERRAEYMREYYKRKPDKFKRTPEQQAEHNRRRRERYASDPEYRERVKKQAERTPEQRRAILLRKSYGISVEQYDAMLAEQGGGCAICGVEFGDKGGRRLAVDHCHDTGAVRGLLCSNCNQGLGKFGDDIARLERAIMYLRRSRDASSDSDQ